MKGLKEKDPFGVEQSHWRKVGELLQQKGLALPKGTAQFIRQKLNCPLESCEDDEATNSDAAILVAASI